MKIFPEPLRKNLRSGFFLFNFAAFTKFLFIVYFFLTHFSENNNELPKQNEMCSSFLQFHS
ncbi:MAG: hypothetical protein CL608_17080 [Anaerolineaceae bacterium]|nr:hypothetical protein [Anaerolineaceae bacterium]